MAITDKMSWFVYKPIDWQKRIGYKVNENRCRNKVWPDRGTAHQCGRKPKKVIEGYGFCTQHAKIICEIWKLNFESLKESPDEPI